MVVKKKYTEKRQYERLNYHCLVKYKPLNEIGDYSETFTSLKNISAGGLLLKLKGQLPLGMKLKVRINIPSFTAPIDAVAEIVRFTEKPGNTGHWSGVKFIEINPGDKSKLAEFCTKSADRHR